MVAVAVLSGGAVLVGGAVFAADDHQDDSEAALRSVTADEALKTGRRAVEQLGASLKAELMQALRKGGPAAAIDICSRRALELTAEIAAASQMPGLALKRTSLRVRNPANAPTETEREVLQAYAAALAKGEALEAGFATADTVYNYFAPIRMQGLCLACHGPAESLGAEIEEALAERYPEDAATGYASGDLRGIFSVTIPRKVAITGESRE